MATVTIKDNMVKAVSPEGQTASMRVADLVEKLAPARMDTGGIVLPDGVKSVLSHGPFTIWVHQTPPCVFQFKWIASDSPARFGKGTRYRTVKLALPYLVTLAVFGPGEDNQAQLTAANECFFRNDPLNSLDDELHYPALLNCSRFTPPDGRPLAWICTQYLDRNLFIHEANVNKRLRVAFRALMHCLLETGFNYSSEHHEGSSWYNESTGVDPRIATVEKWQAATEKDALFVLEVPWLKTGLSVRQVAERIFKNLKAHQAAYKSADDLARLVFNHNQAS